MARAGKEKQREEKDKYHQWKQNIPIMYDWILNHSLTWPSQSCRWGVQVEDFKYKRRQRLYLSDRTDGSVPNKLSVWNVDICKPRVAGAEVLKYDENAKSPFIKPYTTILHPGEVNKIRECPLHPQIVVTHTDAKELYVWDVEKQPNRADAKGEDRQRLSVADLVLTGHEKVAQFALGMSTAQPLVASGGNDCQVLVWNLEDHDNGALLKDSKADASATRKDAPQLPARLKLLGHTNTIEDVVWRPGSATELASVGDDYQLLLWDTRSAGAPAAKVGAAHGDADLHCVDWSPLQPELLVTGAADGSVRVWDRRALASCLHHFRLHSSPIMRVEWAPCRKGVFASGGEDELIAVWDLDRQDFVAAAAAAARAEEAGEKPHEVDAAIARSPFPPQLMFQHAGHRGQVVDFQWHPSDPFTMVSVSDAGEGGTLQVWRVSDLIWRPIDEVLQELEQYKEYILTGKDAPAAAKEPAAAPVPKVAPPETPGDAVPTIAAAGTSEGAEGGASLVEPPPAEGGAQPPPLQPAAPDEAAPMAEDEPKSGPQES